MHPVHGRSERSPAALGRTRVLVVDDDEPTRFLVRILLERTRRFRVVAEADSGAAAIGLARRVRPDIVVLDWEMPRMTGPEALPLLRDAAPGSRIVLFSDRIEEIEADEGEAFRADLLLAKGKDMSTLVPALLRMTAATRSAGRNGGSRA